MEANLVTGERPSTGGIRWSSGAGQEVSHPRTDADALRAGYWAGGSDPPMAQLVDERFLVSLAGELAGCTTGIDFVYRALERVAERHELRDALVVVDEPPAGRQLFR